jgi:addiction module HigA family antidote
VRFGTARLRSCYEDQRVRAKEWGEKIGRRYVQRVDALYAAPDAQALRALRSLRFHALTGDRKGQHAIWLDGFYRLIMTFEGKAMTVVTVEEVEQALRRLGLNERAKGKKAMKGNRRAWPDVAVAPGETLGEELEARGMTQKALAEKMGRPMQVVSEIVRGMKQITAETALQLEAVLEVPAEFWMSLEFGYQLAKARLARKAATARRRARAHV